MREFYDGNKIRTLHDLNGELPGLVIVDGNRSTGKTTNFNIYVFEEWKKTGKKFALLYRYKYELSEVANKFFKEIKKIKKYPGEMLDRSCSYGSYYKLIYKTGDQQECCGYAIALNSAEQIKKQSHEFSDVAYILFDEFQSEYGNYTSHEIDKFQSIYTSVARGNGSRLRFVRVFLLSNSIDIYNPYYSALGVSEKLLLNGSKFIRGKGYVIERNFNVAAAQEFSNCSFFRAFADSKYYENLTSRNSYLNNRNDLILDTNLSAFEYYLTLYTRGKYYGIYRGENFLIITPNVNLDYPVKYCLFRSDLSTNGIKLIPNKLLNYLRFMYDNSRLFATNLETQDIIKVLV